MVWEAVVSHYGQCFLICPASLIFTILPTEICCWIFGSIKGSSPSGLLLLLELPSWMRLTSSATMFRASIPPMSTLRAVCCQRPGWQLSLFSYRFLNLHVEL